VDSAYQHGLSLFNSGRFYDAHEVLEDVWRATAGPEKLFLQGLVQAADGLHHHSTGNLEGARSLLARAYRNLSPYPDSFGGIDLAALRQSLATWRLALERGAPLPPLPRITTAGPPQC
jgi:predicted metal-dependent hydrolase